MRRSTYHLALTVCCLTCSTAVQADDAASLSAGPLLTAAASALDVPPVLPPNDPAAAGLPTSNLDAPTPAATQVPTSAIAPPAAAPVPPVIATPQFSGDPQQPNPPAYFSPRLGARFLLEQQSLPQFGMFWGARIVSPPADSSPLRQLGLAEGDVITRLDGLPLTSTLELERHILETGVRVVRAGEQHVRQGTMFIDPGMYFADPCAPVCPYTTGCGSLVLRP